MKKRGWILFVIVCELILTLIVLFSIFHQTPTRVMEEVYGVGIRERMLEDKGYFSFEFDTQGKPVAGLQLLCYQKGKPVNEGYMVYQVSKDDEIVVGPYRVSLALVNTGLDYLNLEFYQEINGTYTFTAQIFDVSPWDRLVLPWDVSADAHTVIDGKRCRGSFGYNYITLVGTRPYILDAILLTLFVNLFLVLFLGEKIGKDRKTNEAV